MYVLHPIFRQRKILLRCYIYSSRVLFIGLSPKQSSDVCQILNLRTDSISP